MEGQSYCWLLGSPGAPEFRGAFQLHGVGRPGLAPGPLAQRTLAFNGLTCCRRPRDSLKMGACWDFYRGPVPILRPPPGRKEDERPLLGLSWLTVSGRIRLVSSDKNYKALQRVIVQVLVEEVAVVEAVVVEVARVDGRVPEACAGLDRMSTSQPWRRRDPSPRNVHVAAAASPRLVRGTSTSQPRRRRNPSHGISTRQQYPLTS